MAKDQNEETVTPFKKESRVFAALRNYFLTGLVVTAPVGLSLYLVWSVLAWIDEKVGGILPIRLTDDKDIPGLGVIVAIGFFIVVGIFTRNFIGRMLLKLSHYVMERLPVVKTVYGALKQVIDMVMGQQAKAFRDVVMIEYPRKGVYMMGFLTGKTEGEVQALTDKEMVNIFIPTTPNPTSGFLVFVPADEVIDLNMSVDDGLKMIISGGMITPKYSPKKETGKSEG
ncbi:MAG: DUF502 domain-containing protein [Alphaproteobacteria bacterium]|nr:DUF502 domain-containing protein [Alphaproteobacteria bacterium]MCB9985157.1 DUF502 domain-containing protein [Micavibrio sp.]HRK98053.1 DUF502 domain-containing protein [Alphaproteobacteria bacterium]